MQNMLSIQLPLYIATEYGVLDVLSFELEEALDQPYRLQLQITNASANLNVTGLIGKPLNFVITPTLNPMDFINTVPAPRHWHGVVRKMAKLRSNAEETLYSLTVEPRLGQLADFTASRLFQNQSTAEIVESVLRKHGFTGADFIFNLEQERAVRPFTTQYQETDLAFITRLLADDGIWFTFEQGKFAETIIFADDLTHYKCGNLSDVPYREDAGLDSGTKETVRQLHIHQQTMRQMTQLRDYNWRDANNPLNVQAGFKGEKPAALGTHYAFGEHYKTLAAGNFMAQIRQERSIAEQCTASGQGNVMFSRPSEVLRLDRKSAEAPYGWLITRVLHTGSRHESYRNEFNAIPSDRFWRPAIQPWPTISGTLPGRVVSPSNNSYQYAFLDENGNYRVRMPFDLDKWTPAGDSRPMRLAKPYAGPQYGHHFPIHADTEVMVAFVDGNVDRPYIASVMHNSKQMDPLSTQWNTRNVIRTWANNKLRMEDFKGQEHIKLATEFNKTQLNLGHLVDSSRKARGEGFELRSDGWGVVRAGKGLFLSAEGQAKASGQQKDIHAAVSQLENANQIAGELNQAAMTATAESHDMQAQIDLLTQQVKDLQQAVLLASAPAGIALTTPQQIHLASGHTTSITASKSVGISALKNLVANVGNAISLFAQKAGIKMYANHGVVDIQAQHDQMRLSSAQDMLLRSKKKIDIAAQEGIVISAGGSGIKMSQAGLELFSTGPIIQHGAVNNTGPQSIFSNHPDFPDTQPLALYSQQFSMYDRLIDNPDLAVTGYTLFDKEGTQMATGSLSNDSTPRYFAHGFKNGTMVVSAGDKWDVYEFADEQLNIDEVEEHE